MNVVRVAMILACVVSTVLAQQGPTVPKPNPVVPAGVWAIKKEHPRLIGPASFLKDLAQRKQEEFDRVERHDSIRAHGIVRAVKGLDAATVAKHLQLAMDNVARGPTNVHQDSWVWLTQVALTYDLFHDAIPPADRARMIDWMNAHLEKFTTDENAFHNSTLSKIFCYLRIAYSTWGENPRAKDFRDYALIKLYEGKVVPVLNQFGQGGGFTECGWYTRSSLWNLVQGLELARRIEKYDGFQKAPRFFYQRLAYEMHQPYPYLDKMYSCHVYAVEGDGANTYGAHFEYPRLTRMVLANYFRKSELAGYAASFAAVRGSSPEMRLEDFLWQEEPEQPLELAKFPLAHHARGIGRIYARGGWTNDATWFRFECGDFFTNHQHLDVGHFEIVRYAPLATESGEYHKYNDGHAVNWLMRTVAHNCILVEMPGETWPTMRNSAATPANDGGQAWKWKIPDTLQQWNQRRGEYERGEIVAYDNTADYLYLAADCTAAYNPSKLKGWMRQVVFLRPHTFVIMDRVVTAPAAKGKAWVLHSTNEPQVSGHLAEITSGEGKLFVQTLLPAKVATRTVEGYTYGGKTFAAEQSTLTPLAHKWRMEVVPAEPRGDEVFLHVLSTDGKPDATLLSGREVGVKIGQTEVRFTGVSGGTLTIGGKKIPLKAQVTTGRFE